MSTPIQNNSEGLHRILQAVSGLPEAGAGDVTVQRTNGEITTNGSGTATVDCGFQPDVVYIEIGSYESTPYHLAYVFTEHGTSNAGSAAWSDEYNAIEAKCSRTTNGFSVTLTAWSASWSDSAVSDTFNYVAVKYTQ